LSNSEIKKPIKKDKKDLQGEEDDTESSDSEDEKSGYLSKYFWDFQAL
jgi:hypothetical protein